LNAPITLDVKVALPHGVATSSTMPDRLIVTAVAATSALANPYVNSRWPRARDASIRLWPNASSALITATRKPGHVNSLAFAAP
jgi:hypothetical protein